MTETLYHRGPDDEGFWVDGEAGVALGHRRLSILDITPTGRQPMISICGRYVVAFNGEIYNFKTLRAELEKSGSVFRGTSDTEVMLACFSRYGFEKSIGLFNGMFAIALWDREEQSLRLIRDRFGEKPLYYGAAGEDFVFGSELKALKVHPQFSLSIDRTALTGFFRYGFVPQPFSIYEGVSKVPAGTAVAVRFDREAWGWRASPPVPYWEARAAVDCAQSNPFCGDEDEAVSEFEKIFDDAAGIRLESDVPLGAFLSGGIDSSAVVAAARKAASGRLRTFSIGFAEASHDESANAAVIARALGTEHASLTVTAREALAVIPKLPSLYDEPFADSSQIPTYLVSEFTRSHVKVSLSGDGGDELFGGYVRHVRGPPLWKLFSHFPAGLRGIGAMALRTLSPRSWNGVAGFLRGGAFAERHFGDKVQKLAGSLGADSAFHFYLALLSAGRSTDILLLDAGSIDPLEAALSGLWRHEGRGFAENAMLCDAAGYLEGIVMTKVDRASMGVSLESRAPFLDHRVFEFAWRLPLSFKIRGGLGKVILRKFLSRFLPEETFNRPKTGFHMPVGNWLKGPLRDWAESFLRKRDIETTGFLRAERVLKLWHEHLSGAFNHGERLWGILMFQAWLKTGMK